MTRLLHDNITGGTGTAAYTGCEGQAGKTGTTDGLTDAWFAGFQPNLSTVGLGRLPGVERDRNDQRPRHLGLRRHLPGGNLALGLRQRRNPLRELHRTGEADHLGALLRPLHARTGRPATRSPTRRRAAPKASCRDRTRSAATTPTPMTRTPTRPAPARSPTCRRRRHPLPRRPPPAAAAPGSEGGRGSPGGLEGG